MSVPPLLASCWTHAGDAAPQRPDERSPFDILDRVTSVADAGWQGIGLVHADLVEAKRTVGLPRLASAIRDSGLEHVEVEFLGDWWTSGADRAASDEVRRDLFEAAEVLGARTIKAAGRMFSDDVDLDVMAASFDRLADEAREHGARIAMETLPFTNFRTVGDGSRFVSGVGNSNGGILVDIWHVYRAGNVPDDLLRDVDPKYLFAVELNDALAQTPAYEDLWADTVDERRLPGEGDWDVPRFIEVIRELGYTGVWGVEILSAEHRRKSLRDEVTSAVAATRRVFEAVESGAGADSTR